MFKKLIKLKIIRRKIKPVVFYLPENVHEMFVDVEFLDEYRKSSPLNENWYQGLKLTFGIDIFVFDVNSCRFTKGNEFEELNKAGKALFDEIAKALRLKEICDFLEKELNKIFKKGG